MATDLSAVASAKVLTTTADAEFTLDPDGVYVLTNNGAQDVYFSTDGSTVVANTDTLVGQGMIAKVAIVAGIPIQVAGVAILKIRSAATTAQVTISRAGSFPATER